ncbi:MAG: hypothetical protein WDO73_32535 [Ignavibacteriota bacterium]
MLTFAAWAADPRKPTEEGLVYGQADGQTLTMDYYAPAGYAAFSINYRLAPKYPYPISSMPSSDPFATCATMPGVAWEQAEIPAILEHPQGCTMEPRVHKHGQQS